MERKADANIILVVVESALVHPPVKTWKFLYHRLGVVGQNVLHGDNSMLRAGVLHGCNDRTDVHTIKPDKQLFKEHTAFRNDHKRIPGIVYESLVCVYPAEFAATARQGTIGNTRACGLSY